MAGKESFDVRQLQAPTAAEAPFLIPPYNEPKPFFSLRSFRAFSLSMAVGAACAGSVYYMMTSAMSRTNEEEAKLLAAVEAHLRSPHHDQHGEEGNDRGTVAPPVLPKFIPPSCYGELETLANRVEPIRQIDHHGTTVTAANSSIPALHQEAQLRFKLGWNDRVSELQRSIEMFTLYQQQKRYDNAQSSIRQKVKDAGFELVDLQSNETHEKASS